MKAKNINMNHMNADAQGCAKYTLTNWTGAAYKIPRNELDECRDCEELKQSGIYFLLRDSDETGKEIIRIDQAGYRENGEDILSCLQAEKNEWTEAIAFTAGNELSLAETSYLKQRFSEIAEIRNGSDQIISNLSEEKESEMEDFLDHAMIIMEAI